jgi:hypothetical protein
MSLGINKLLVPLENSRVLEISQSKLPEDPKSIINLFNTQKIPIKYWLKLAVSEYILK